MKSNYDVKIREQEYKPGDLVYVLDTAKIKGRAKKLDPSWKGPGIVVEKLSSYVYKVTLKTMTFTTNHDRLKHCHDRESVGHALLSSQQLLFASLFSMLSPKKEMEWPQLLLSLGLAPGSIVRHQGVRYLFC
jgi:hypothetical protein